MINIDPNRHCLCEYSLQCCSNKNEQIFQANMENKCCLPKCNSNYKSSVSREGMIRCFSFQKDKILQAAWLRKIPRSSFTISKNTVVCIKHFKEGYVIKEDVNLGKEVNPDVFIPRKHFKLKHSAISCVFPNLPLCFSELTSAPKSR